MEEMEETAQEVTYAATDIDTAQVTEIGIIKSDETINLSQESGEWKLKEDENFEVDKEVVESFLSDAGNITSDRMIEDVEDFSEYGLEYPVLNITLQWDSNMYLIKVGDYNTVVGCYYISVNDENTVYTISTSQYYALDKTLNDFEKIQEETSETASETE